MIYKKEYLFVFLCCVGMTGVSYSVASSYFKKNTEVQPLKFLAQEKNSAHSKIKQEPISLLFVGDIMLDRTIRKDGELYGYNNLFSCLKDEFKKHDEVIGNLEGTITNFESVSRNAQYLSPESYRFTFNTNSVQALMDIGLSIVSIGNNHVRDFGEEGIVQTINHSQQMNLDVFGDPRIGSQKYILKNIKGTIVAFIPYNQFFGTEEQTYKDLEDAKNISDIQIIFAHWGDEYVPVGQDTRNLAYTFVDKGADIIIGAHPHVIQDKEEYKGVQIYYSLGNFIFDQYWEESVSKGLTVSVLIQDKKINSFEERYVQSMRHKGTCFKNTSL